MSRESGVARRKVDRASGQAARLVDAAEPQRGPSQSLVRPGEMRHNSRRGELLDDLFTDLNLVGGLGRLAELRGSPCRGGERARQLDGDVPALEHGEAVLAQLARGQPFAAGQM